MRSAPMFVTRTLLLLLIVCGLTACDPFAPPKPKQYTWTEDVTLDARSVRMRRVVFVIERNSWSGDAYNAVETESRIEFMDELASLPPWSEALKPIAIYQDVQEWVVVATTSSCAVWLERGKPRPPYWEYRLRERGWEQVPLSEASLGRRANLAQKFKSMAVAGHVTPDLRAQLDYSNPIRKYREVYAAPDQPMCGQGNYKNG